MTSAALRQLASAMPPAHRAAVLAQMQPDAPKVRRGMNKTEAAFAAHLRGLKLLGRILWYGYEAMKFRLAERTTLTPDFMVLTEYGKWEALDCKGSKRKANGDDGYWCEDDAKVKIKLAAELIPIRFAIVFRAGDEWKRQDFHGLIDDLEITTKYRVAE